MKLRALLVGAVLVAMASAASAEPVRIYVVQNAGGFVDEKSDSAKDLLCCGWTKASDAKAAKADMVLVTSPETADVIVEIVGRELAPNGLLRAGVADLDYHVTAKLTAGAYTTTLLGISTSAYGGFSSWAGCASHLHGQIAKFAKSNSAKLIAERKPAPDK
jgi:hypothetical protein